MTQLALIRTLPPAVERCREIVTLWLRKQTLSDVRLLHQAQLAAFVDINHGSINDFTIPCLKGLIAVAVVKGSKNGVLRAAFIDSELKYAADLGKVLASRRVPAYVGDITDAQAIDAFLQTESSAAGCLKLHTKVNTDFALKDVTNAPERAVITLVKESLGVWIGQKKKKLLLNNGVLADRISSYLQTQKAKYRVYEEYALGAILDGYSLPASDWNSLQNFRADVLVASSPPQSMPLLVIEFDGREHRDNPNKARSDVFRDTALLAAGIPVLRISSQNSLLPGKVEAINDPERKFFSLYFQLLVGRLAEQIHFDRIRQSEAWEPVSTALVSALERRCDEYRKIQSRIDIPQDVLRRMYEEANDDLAGPQTKVASELAIEEYESLQEWQSMLDPNSYPTQTGEAITTVKEPEVRGAANVKHGSFAVHMMVRLGGVSKSLVSPEIFIELKLPKSCEAFLETATEAAVISLLSGIDGQSIRISQQP